MTLLVWQLSGISFDILSVKINMKGHEISSAFYLLSVNGNGIGTGTFISFPADTLSIIEIAAKLGCGVIWVDWSSCERRQARAGVHRGRRRRKS